jgi:hypothetical protein
MKLKIHEIQKIKQQNLSKTRNFLAIAIITVASVTSQVVAQETETVSTKVRQTQGTNFGDRVNAGLQQASGLVSGGKTSIKIVPTETGCDIVSWSWGVSNSGNHSGGGSGAGKHVQSIVYVQEESSNTEKIVQGKHFPKATLSVSSPDADETQESSKVNVQDLNFTKKYDTASPVIANRRLGGKVNVQDISFTVYHDRKIIPTTIDNDTCTLPEDLPNGDYNVVCSWSWGAHESGTNSQKTIDCHLKIENGVCVDMAINEKR